MSLEDLITEQSKAFGEFTEMAYAFASGWINIL